jgi:hypothetical protein
MRSCPVRVDRVFHLIRCNEVIAMSALQQILSDETGQRVRLGVEVGRIWLDVELVGQQTSLI